MTINNIKIPEEQLKRICERYSIKELVIFGSALDSDFNDESDIDLLYIFDEHAQNSLFTKVRIKEELEKLFGRPVDLISKVAIETSRNIYKKEAILKHSKVIYAA